MNPLRTALVVFASALCLSTAAFAADWDVNVDVDLYAPSEPPVVRYEAAPPAPGYGYEWAPGYWYWADSGWTWIPGAWMAPPAVGFVWFAPRWEHQGRGWHYVTGGWGSRGGRYVSRPVYRHRAFVYREAPRRERYVERRYDRREERRDDRRYDRREERRDDRRDSSREVRRYAPTPSRTGSVREVRGSHSRH